MNLSKPVVVYLVMIVVLVGGLWAVLALGGNLSAAEDLAGKWELHPIAGGSEGKTMNIEQSGEFFQISIDQGKLMDLKLHEHSSSKLVLSNRHTQLTVSGNEGGDDKTFLLTGDKNGQWNAHRTVRTFPADVSATEGK